MVWASTEGAVESRKQKAEDRKKIVDFIIK